MQCNAVVDGRTAVYENLMRLAGLELEPTGA